MPLPKFRPNQNIDLPLLGRSFSVKYLDEGSFAQCFLDLSFSDTVLLLVPDSEFGQDTAKEILCDIRDENNPYLPAIEPMGGDNIFGVYCRVFQMPFYRDITPKDKAWVEMKQLHKYRDDSLYETYDFNKRKTGDRGSLTTSAPEMNRRIVEKAKAAKMNTKLIKALFSMYKASQTNPGMAMEFNKSNTAVNKDGNLVLRDTLYDSAMAVRIKDALKKK